MKTLSTLQCDRDAYRAKVGDGAEIAGDERVEVFEVVTEVIGSKSL